ncbi:2-dehydro-3-deoxy-6-phosphogalactonate aldolase [Tahibacter harae]|uniref:2-dehydro-3-deoxy-6-phosphogalactonate aldolase n=1 Tax=Tahibacter harae TaxID=2963937 RepID=A0ABT1QT83_9GAMM|nr:2-dehydro-3-deoxy-6-phosphogalactonate aldolase [Tahibacter harae]MCQ4165500.1 2-dehydro-3-deoxy-6-phosphogalactonate aldolase [Tahibacter harae]
MGFEIDNGIIAILRGLRPERAVQTAALCYRHGIRVMEVPLNSPEPLRSIEYLAAAGLPGCRIGAGTVLSAAAVDRVRGAGAEFIVTPNVDGAVIRAARDSGLAAIPGFATPTEAFAALAAGADMLKLFPAASYGPGHLKALRAVLPPAVRVFAVGGVVPAQCGLWRNAGAAGFGFGSELFRPDEDDAQLDQRIGSLMQAYRAAGGVCSDSTQPLSAE